MIWLDTPLAGTSREQLAEKLLDDVPTLCGNPLLADHPCLAEAVQGVALYLDQIEMIPESMNRTLSRELLAQALEAAGEGGLARRIRLFGNRIIGPARWTACGSETVWVLDLQQLAGTGEDGMEMILFDRIRLVLATVADVWDATSGRGFLGLKGLEPAAASITGPSPASRKGRALAAELRGFCAYHLSLLQKQRGWQAAPAMLILLS